MKPAKRLRDRIRNKKKKNTHNHVYTNWSGRRKIYQLHGMFLSRVGMISMRQLKELARV